MESNVTILERMGLAPDATTEAIACKVSPLTYNVDDCTECPFVAECTARPEMDCDEVWMLMGLLAVELRKSIEVWKKMCPACSDCVCTTGEYGDDVGVECFHTQQAPAYATCPLLCEKAVQGESNV